MATNYLQDGNIIIFAPGADVASGIGHLKGAALFGVAVNDVANGVAGAFICSGVVKIGKTSALAISVGDRLFWDATNKVVNKTSTAQQQVGVAVSDASNPSATVDMLITAALPAAT